MQDLGTKIKSARKALKLTLKDMAERTGFTQGYLSKIENNLNIPTPSGLKEISEILNIPYIELMIDAGHYLNADDVESLYSRAYEVFEIINEEIEELEYKVKLLYFDLGSIVEQTQNSDAKEEREALSQKTNKINEELMLVNSKINSLLLKRSGVESELEELSFMLEDFEGKLKNNKVIELDKLLHDDKTVTYKGKTITDQQLEHIERTIELILFPKE